MHWWQLFGKETRQEESGGEGGEKEGTLIFGGCESESFSAVIFYFFSCLVIYCQCLIRADAESTCANKC